MSSSADFDSFVATTDQPPKPIPKYNVILLGEVGVGKTSLFRRLNGGDFSEYVQVERSQKEKCTFKVTIEGNVEIELTIYDTAGMERLGTLTRNYYNDTHGVVIVYDVTNETSLDHVIRWNNDATMFTPNAIRMLLGNKAENDDTSVIKREEGEEFAEKNQFDVHATASNKTGRGITEAFEALALKIHTNNTTVSLRNPFRHGMIRVNTQGTIIKLSNNKVKDSRREKTKCC